jgi:hypothetical protein
LHFEVWANGSPLDPLTVLQSGAVGAGLSIDKGKLVLVLLVFVLLTRL